MARGKEGGLRRRENRKKAKEDVVDMFGEQGDEGESDMPLPPGMKKSMKKAADSDGDSSDSDDDIPILPKKGKKGRKKSSAPGGDSCGSCCAPPGGGGGGGIKTTPLILLIMLVGTSVLPALIYASDYLGAFMAKNHVLGQIGFRMGMGGVPRKRVLSFYEKHAPEKLGDVPTILSKHYGDYPLLIKKLERKYQDYGYFIGWEEDEAPMKLAMEQVQDLYDTWLQKYWNRHAPQVLKTSMRNVRYNLTFLLKRFKRVWKKQIWPWLEPVFGVPDGAAAQKRKDRAEAQKAQRAKEGMMKNTRRKNTDFRDDVED